MNLLLLLHVILAVVLLQRYECHRHAFADGVEGICDCRNCGVKYRSPSYKADESTDARPK